jgi:hypothetical protein
MNARPRRVGCDLRDAKSCESYARSRGRFATPADFTLHDGTPYRGLHARRESLGFVHRSRAIFCRAAPNPNVTIRNLCIAVQPEETSFEVVGCVLADGA